MRELLPALLQIILFNITANAQTCECPAEYIYSNSADRLFEFSNGKSVKICGFSGNKGADTIYSEFAVVECNSGKALRTWDATQDCRIVLSQDTLTIQDLILLPIGKDMSVINTTFFVTQYFTANDAITSYSYFRKDLPLYSKAQMEQALSNYNAIQEGNTEANILIAYQLFWAFVSGSTAAEEFLKVFEEKPGGFDGASAEEYHSLMDVYQQYKVQKK